MTILFSRIHLRGWQQNDARRRIRERGQHPGGGARGEEKEEWGGAKSIMEESNSSTNSPAADGERESETTRWNTLTTHTITIITVNIFNSAYKRSSNKLTVTKIQSIMRLILVLDLLLALVFIHICTKIGHTLLAYLSLLLLWLILVLFFLYKIFLFFLATSRLLGITWN